MIEVLKLLKLNKKTERNLLEKCHPDLTENELKQS